jgi:outer membrane lipoprotein-sorting protein
MSLNAEGRPVYQISLENCSNGFADRLTARLWKEGESRSKVRIEIEYRDLEINRKVDGKVFDLKIPDHAQRISNP